MQQRTVDPHKVIENLAETVKQQAIRIAQLEAFIADNVPQETT